MGIIYRKYLRFPIFAFTQASKNIGDSKKRKTHAKNTSNTRLTYLLYIFLFCFKYIFYSFESLSASLSAP